MDINEFQVLLTETVRQVVKEELCIFGETLKKKTKKSTEETEAQKELKIKAQEIIQYFNEITGSKCKLNGKFFIEQICARLQEGYEVEDCKKVIDNRYDAWKDTDMRQYIRIDTLFKKTKFPNYLSVAEANESNGPTSIINLEG